MLTHSETPKSRREFVSGMRLAAMTIPFMAAASSGKSTSSQKAAKPVPFDAEGPFDSRLRPADGFSEYFKQSAQWQTFDHFGRTNWTRDAIGYGRRQEFRKEGEQELWHRITWKFVTEEDRDGYGQRLAAKLYPYSKNFSYESPVTGGLWDIKMDLQAIPRTAEGFVFLHHLWDMQTVFFFLSEKRVNFDELKRIGDSTTAAVDPKTLGDNWFTRPTWEFTFEPSVQYWLGEFRLTLSLAGLTKVGDDWCTLQKFDASIPERMAFRDVSGGLVYHILSLLTGNIAILLETNHMVHCGWNHFAMLGTEEIPSKPRDREAMPGLTLLWRQIQWTPVSEKEFVEAVPQV